MTLPRILSTLGRTLAVLGAVMLLFVVFQLWGTGLQQAQAQSNLEDDFAERFREAGQAAGRIVGEAPQDAASPEIGESTDPAAAVGATAVETGSDQADPGSAPPDGADPPAAGEGVPAATEPSPDPSAPPESPGDGTTAGAPAETVAPDTSPATLPALPSLPSVVSHISEPAAARAVARLLDPEVEELLPLVYPEAGEAIARITIPSIDVDTIVVAGVEIDDLRRGPGHYSTTPLPGQPGNAAIAGHRTTYGAPFGQLNELNAGDTIIVETLQGRFTYRVLPGQPGMAGHALGFRIVAPTALEVLDDVGDNRLTLTTCHPKYSSKKRLIVHAALVGDPVVRLPRPGEPIGAEYVQLAAPDDPPDAADDAERPADPAPAAAGRTDRQETPDAGAGTVAEPDAVGGGGAAESTGDAEPAAPSEPAGSPGTRPDAAAEAESPVRASAVTEVGFGQGLSGDPGAILPAVLWGLAAAAVWGLGWRFGRSGRRALRYTVAAVPFLVVLYVMFSYIDRALPAY